MYKQNTIFFNDSENEIGIWSLISKTPQSSPIFWDFDAGAIKRFLLLLKVEIGKISNIVSIEVSHENVEYSHIIGS